MKKLFFAVPFLMLAAGCGGPGENPRAATAPAAPVAVQVIPAAASDWPANYETTGTVRARTTTAVSAKWMGYVREVRVHVGDHVQAGQTVVVLDARDLDASAGRAAAGREEVRASIPEAESAIAMAKANLDLAQTTFRRMNELYTKKSISDQEFDEASAKVKAAQAAYDAAKARRAQIDAKLAQAAQDVRATEVTRTYAEIQSPLSGVVTAKPVDPGMLAVPGTPLLTIEGDGYRFEAQVDESRAASIHQGQTATLTIDGIDAAIESRISEIVPEVDSASRAYIVKLDLPGRPTLRSGLFGRAAFHTGSRSVLAVPDAAIQQRGQLQSVFVADAGAARVRLITTGGKSQNQTEVLSGLSPGDKVIFPAPSNLQDGARIEVKP
jgi:multidrug efflux system membrane fusion protein